MLKPESVTLPGLIDELARRYPDRPAVSFEGETLTFGAFRHAAIAFAKALHADGVAPGDHVGLVMGNRLEWLIACFGIQYAGASLVAMNTWYTPREFAYVLGHADISAVVTVDRYLKVDYVAMLDDPALDRGLFPRLRRVVMLGDRTAAGAVSWDDYLAGGTAVGDAQIAAVATAIAPDDMAFLLYTSGSTAHPKGVMLEHRGLIGNMWDIGERLQLDDTDTMFFPISLFWGMGCENMLFTCWTHGVHIVLQDRFDPGDALAQIERHHCTAMCATPNIVHAIFEHPERAGRDISYLRKGVAPGSPEATRAVIEAGMSMAGHCYGLTETYGFVTCNGPDDSIAQRTLTEGSVMPGMDVRVVDPVTERVLGADDVGEVRVRGFVLRQYYKAPEANAASFDANGYFRTGDLGSLDEGGYLTFRGRLKEMIKTGGMNVSPIEVEEVIREVPGVREVFVTALPDPVRDQVAVAVIVAEAGAALSHDAIVAACADKLAAYKLPRRSVFVTMDGLPLTSTGKVHRMRLVELFEPAPATAP